MPISDQSSVFHAWKCLLLFNNILIFILDLWLLACKFVSAHMGACSPLWGQMELAVWSPGTGWIEKSNPGPLEKQPMLLITKQTGFAFLASVFVLGGADAVTWTGFRRVGEVTERQRQPPGEAPHNISRQKTKTKQSFKIYLLNWTGNACERLCWLDNWIGKTSPLWVTPCPRLGSWIIYKKGHDWIASNRHSLYLTRFFFFWLYGFLFRVLQIFLGYFWCS